MVEKGLVLNNTYGMPQQLTLNPEYSGTGPNAGRYTVSHKWANDYQQVVQELTLLRGSGVKVVYLGLPLLHMLYDPHWGHTLPVCDSGFDMRAASHGMLDAVQLEADEQGITVLLGTGNSHLPIEEASMVTSLNTQKVASEWCKVCFQNQRCEEFSQSVSGMVAANRIVIEAMRDPKYARIKLMRFDQVTHFRRAAFYTGGGHYDMSVSDQKVALLLSTASTAHWGFTEQRLQTLAKHKVVFVGDSPTRRLYIRSVVHLEHIYDKNVAENLQNNAKQVTKDQRDQMSALNLTDHSTGMAPTRYVGQGANKGLSLEYVMVEELSTSWVHMMQSWNARFVYFGIPLLHVLYNPQWRTAMCDESFNLREAIATVLQQLEQATAQLNMIVFVGTANTYSDLDDKANSKLIEQPETILDQERKMTCTSCWHKPRCEEFSQTHQGMAAANQIVIDTIEDFKHLRILRMDQATTGQPIEMYLGGGHYKGPVIDHKLELLVSDAMLENARFDLAAVACKPEIFEMMDTDRDGTILRSEFEIVCSAQSTP